ncbi:MAG: archaeosortase H [Candidatus Hodarchaeota archaeon]
MDILGREHNRLQPKKRIYIWMFYAINILFSLCIGLTIPILRSESRYNFGIFMIPLLVILNYIIADRYIYYLKHIDDEGEVKEDDNKKSNRPIIEFEGKKYIFSVKSIILFAFGAPVSAYLIFLFFDFKINFWLHEIVVKQTVLFLNLFFDMGANTGYTPVGKYYWEFIIPGRSPIGFETFCTGVQAICVFAGIIIFTPHSRDPGTSEDIVWRKAKALIVSSVIFYVVNIIRMLIQIYLYYVGYDWDDIHVSISAASSFIAAIIVILLHKWIPEFIISIIYTGTLISQKVKKLRGIPIESKDKLELKSKKKS